MKLKFDPLYFWLLVMVVCLGIVIRNVVVAETSPITTVRYPIVPLTAEEKARNAFDHNNLNPDMNYPNFKDRLIFHIPEDVAVDPRFLVQPGENKIVIGDTVTILEEDISEAYMEIFYHEKGRITHATFHIPTGQKDVYFNQYDLNGKQ